MSLVKRNTLPTIEAGEVWRSVPFGPDNYEETAQWKIPVALATKEVAVNGSIAMALLGKPAKTCACAMSMFCLDNRKGFSHDVHEAVTWKSSIIIVDRIRQYTDDIRGRFT